MIEPSNELLGDEEVTNRSDSQRTAAESIA